MALDDAVALYYVPRFLKFKIVSKTSKGWLPFFKSYFVELERVGDERELKFKREVDRIEYDALNRGEVVDLTMYLELYSDSVDKMPVGVDKAGNVICSIVPKGDAFESYFFTMGEALYRLKGKGVAIVKKGSDEFNLKYNGPF